MGSAVFDDYIEAYREWARTACPIRGLDRQAEGSQHTFYHKGAILLYDLQQRIGDKAFFGLLHRLTSKPVDCQAAFDREVIRSLGQDTYQWIDRRLSE